MLVIEYEEDIDQYAELLQGFIEKYELPDNWFKTPDHLAIKCADSLDFDYTLQELLADASQVSQIEMDKRRLATLNLTSKIQIGELGSVEWLEIMEPRPENVGKDVVGLEHLEYYYPDFDEIREILEKYHIDFTEQSNSGLSWISIVLNKEGQELKLNNKLLANIVDEQLENGEARLIGV